MFKGLFAKALAGTGVAVTSGRLASEVQFFSLIRKEFRTPCQSAARFEALAVGGGRVVLAQKMPRRGAEEYTNLSLQFKTSQWREPSSFKKTRDKVCAGLMVVTDEPLGASTRASAFCSTSVYLATSRTNETSVKFAFRTLSRGKASAGSD